MLILIASAPVFILKRKLGEIRFIEVNNFPVFFLNTVKLLNEILPLRIKLYFIQRRQVLFLAHLLSLYFVFKVKSTESGNCDLSFWEASMEKYSSHLQCITCPFLERVRIQQEINMLLSEQVLFFYTRVKLHSLRMSTQVLNRVVGLLEHDADLLVREIRCIADLREFFPEAKQACSLS